MKFIVVFVSVVMVLTFLQLAQPAAGSSAARQAAPAADFPRPEKLTIGYLPIIYITQFAAALDQGWFDELGVPNIEFLRFTTGLPMLQGMATDQIDITYIGIGPVIIAGHRGLPVKAVAATSKDTMALVTTETFAHLYAAYQPPLAAFAAFANHTGRKLKMGTLPRGTTPDVFLRLWLDGVGIQPEKDMEIVPMGGDQLVAAMAAGQVDGVAIGEPQITLIQHTDPKFKVLLYGKDLVPGLPGGVVMVQQRLIDQYPALVEKPVEIHLRVTKRFNAGKEVFARAATKFLGEQFLPLELSRGAVRSPAIHMVTDLRPLLPILAVYDASEVKQGIWPKPTKVEDVLDLRFYDAVLQKYPELADEAKD
jgi:NitT/TauT family transport system substrate-binding protein